MIVYEERLSADKDAIRKRVIAVGQRVRDAIGAAVDGMLRLDRAKCSRLILGDLPVNREIRAINKLCHAFIARHLPSAGHLRFVSSVLQMNIALERIGDYAVTIAREGVQLTTAPPAALSEEIRDLTTQSQDVLDCALRAFAGQDVELARETKPQTKAVGHVYDRLYHHLIKTGAERPLDEAFALLTVCHRLGRVSDQAKNICEETLFELTGETKPPKRYRILFVDARDTLVAPLAVALARKGFPESGSYSSAGYQAGERLAPELEELAQTLSLDVSDLQPTALTANRKFLEQFHVIVALTPEASEQISTLPYTTVLLEWQLPRIADANGKLAERLRELSQQLSHEIHELMVTMRGEDAS